MCGSVAKKYLEFVCGYQRLSAVNFDSGAGIIIQSLTALYNWHFSIL